MHIPVIFCLYEHKLATLNMLLWAKLSEFVEKVCKGRDDSHGHKHMENVANNALKILVGEEVDCYRYLDKVMTVAWLHDVADHKYDKDGTLKMQVREFVGTIFADEKECDIIMKIIDLISYSKENNAIKNGTIIDFEKELGKENAFIRHVISDADKLEAMGKIGVQRCVEFTQHTYKEKHGIDIDGEVLKQTVKEHANEKLLRLKDEFMRTNTGKKMAEKLHDELIQALNDM